MRPRQSLSDSGLLDTPDRQLHPQRRPVAVWHRDRARTRRDRPDVPSPRDPSSSVSGHWSLKNVELPRVTSTRIIEERVGAILEIESTPSLAGTALRHRATPAPGDGLPAPAQASDALTRQLKIDTTTSTVPRQPSGSSLRTSQLGMGSIQAGESVMDLSGSCAGMVDGLDVCGLVTGVLQRSPLDALQRVIGIESVWHGR